MSYRAWEGNSLIRCINSSCKKKREIVQKKEMQRVGLGRGCNELGLGGDATSWGRGAASMCCRSPACVGSPGFFEEGASVYSVHLF